MNTDGSEHTIHRADSLVELLGWQVYPRSPVESAGLTYFLARQQASGEKRLGILGSALGFETAHQVAENTWLCPLTPTNAAELRTRLPWLRTQPLGLMTSFSFGDRLGLATPGHIQAAREFGTNAVFAQQSVRENARTQRTPRMVLDDAAWGAFQQGWREPWGADADHIKEFVDVDSFVAAGYTTYTFDPGDHVDSAADSDPIDTLQAKVRALPWQRLRGSPEALYKSYLERPFDLENRRLVFDETTLLRAVTKYGRAIAHAAAMYHYLAERLSPQRIGERPFEVEISVDETETPTSIYEHFLFASELKRLEVYWISLAPRFVGLFAKGVDYIGNLEAFTADVQGHAAVARALGPYKISLHSGSDKFSIYPLAFQATGGLVHVKTAGTSYLEALRVIARQEPAFFREILDLSRRRFEADKVTYILSVQPERVPAAAALSDDQLPPLLDDFNTRQVLHVTYGSVLDCCGDELKAALSAHEEVYNTALKTHFAKHLEAFRG